MWAHRLADAAAYAGIGSKENLFRAGKGGVHPVSSRMAVVTFAETFLLLAHRANEISAAVDGCLHLGQLLWDVLVLGFLLKVMECIQREADAEQDAHSMNMVRIYLELILEFLLRLYDQQFELQAPQNQEMLSRFENLLHDYFAQRLSKKMGLPRVEYFAGQFGYTPKYFSDLIKKSIGIGAQDYILSYTTNLAKHMMLLPGASVKETAYELGFQYPQHFTRFFRNQVGCSPKEFKKLMGEPTSPESPLLTDAEGLHR